MSIHIVGGMAAAAAAQSLVAVARRDGELLCAMPPSEKPSDADVIAFVRANLYSIGYVSADAPIGTGVHVVTIAR